MKYSKALIGGVIIIACVVSLSLAQTGGLSKDNQTIQFTGSSGEKTMSTAQNYDAALNTAVNKAYAQLTKRGADMMLEYTVTKVSGRKGGFAGFNEVTVTISVPKSVYKGGGGGGGND